MKIDGTDQRCRKIALISINEGYCLASNLCHFILGGVGGDTNLVTGIEECNYGYPQGSIEKSGLW